MRLLIHTVNRTIHDASNWGTWAVSAGFEIVDVPGDAGQDPDEGTFKYPWPNGHPTRCRLAADGVTIEAIPGLDSLPIALQKDAERRDFEDSKVFRAFVLWLAQRFGITPAQARQELLTIYRSL